MGLLTFTVFHWIEGGSEGGGVEESRRRRRRRRANQPIGPFLFFLFLTEFFFFLITYNRMLYSESFQFQGTDLRMENSRATKIVPITATSAYQRQIESSSG